MTSRLDHALALARKGLLIIPLPPLSKRAVETAWQKKATTNEDVIREWFENPDINYGVSGGSEFVIIDPDLDPNRDKDGWTHLTALESAQDAMDSITGSTFMVGTPRGGRHLYLKVPYPVRNSVGRFAPGIDIRGMGGYVVGPGSVTDADPSQHQAAGEYVPLSDFEIEDAPQWVLDRISIASQKSESADESVVEEDLPENIAKCRQLIRQQVEWPTEGQGGDTATLHFAELLVRDHYLSQETAFELLTEPLYEDGDSWNDRCDPPWQDDGLRTKIENARLYGTTQLGSVGGIIGQFADYGSDFVKAAEAEKRLERFTKLREITWRGDELACKEWNDEMIIPEWLPAEGFSQCLALRRTGKTTVMWDMMARIACDMDWHGLPIAPGWTVIYLCAENVGGFRLHQKAWEKFHKRLPEKDRFITIGGVPSLMSGEDVKFWAEYCRELVKDRRTVIVVDTWQRATSHGSQNDDKEMATAVANVEALGKTFHGPVVGCFHPPKHNGKTTTGWAGIENASQGIILIEKQEDGRTRKVTLTGTKGGGDDNYKVFDWNEIEVGEVNQFGKQKKGVVPIQSAGTGAEETLESIQRTHSARYLYASIIAEIIMEFPAEEKVKSSFSLNNMSVLVANFIHDSKNAGWQKKLLDVQDFSWRNRSSSGLRTRITKLFKENTSAQTTESGCKIRLASSASRNSFFEIVTAANDREEHDAEIARASLAETLDAWGV